MKKKRPPIPSGVSSPSGVSRQEIWVRQNGLCFYCKKPMTSVPKRQKQVMQDAGTTPENLATLDHYIPKAYGGTSLPDNIVYACIKCNGKKADVPPFEINTSLVQNRVGPYEIIYNNDGSTRGMVWRGHVDYWGEQKDMW